MIGTWGGDSTILNGRNNSPDVWNVASKSNFLIFNAVRFQVHHFFGFDQKVTGVFSSEFFGNLGFISNSGCKFLSFRAVSTHLEIVKSNNTTH